jgi:hypothetical protein
MPKVRIFGDQYLGRGLMTDRPSCDAVLGFNIPPSEHLFLAGKALRVVDQGTQIRPRVEPRDVHVWILCSYSIEGVEGKARLTRVRARLPALCPGEARGPNRRRGFATLAMVRIFRKSFASFWIGQFDGVYAWSATINAAGRG